jgi:hypothetical protein
MVNRNETGVRLRWDVITTVVAWLIGGVLAYGSLDGRIKVLEAKYQLQSEVLHEIQSDIKTLLRLSGDQP